MYKLEKKVPKSDGNFKKVLTFASTIFSISNHLNEQKIMAYVIGDDCISCGTCQGECPVEAISEGADKYVIDADACTECGTCASVCPSEAISLG